MYKLSGLLLAIFLLCGRLLHGQVENSPDSMVRDYTSYDTILPKDELIDTVHHILQDTTHHQFNDQLNMAREKAEVEKMWIKSQISNLTSHNMYGRGYVKDGRDTAALYILRKFKEFKLTPVIKGGPWAQAFAFPVNTFPGMTYLAINGVPLLPGVDFIIDPASPSFISNKLKVEFIDLDRVTDTAMWRRKLASMDAGHAWFFEHLDSFCSRVLEIRKKQFAATLPRGCYIIPEDGKLTWGVSRESIAATVFYVDRDALPPNTRKISVGVNSLFLPHARSENLIACAEGDLKDSFIVFTAHYDHLGMMGDTTVFPGASDNASGVAVLLYLASYFAKHPQHYSILFIAFAGEECALMGSEFYVAHPFVPLKKIKFLTNIDIMGDATNGVTVVNATLFPEKFDRLKKLNDRGKYVPRINSRGPAANGDHYYFTQAGVPSFFIYSDGGKGFYHDIFDKARELSLNHVDDFARMMIDFVKEMK